MKIDSNKQSLQSAPARNSEDLWKFIQQKLSAGDHLILLIVLQSEGSSPGRQGFKMAVAGDGEINGTIGGGIMEHKLVEKARSLLQQNVSSILLQEQFHDKEQSTNQSGMICSGSQLNAFIPLSPADKKIIGNIIDQKETTIQLSPSGININSETPKGLQYNTDEDWLYTEVIDQRRVIHIIGGGHVGLALSELMNYLGYYIKLYDDRPELNTISANSFAHEKHIINYENIAEGLTVTENDLAVIVTVGYRTDKIVLRQLIDKPFFYIGLMGSDHKIETLLNELKVEGIDASARQNLFTPIGINIFSKTAREIAVSIAAQIILEKNKDLPTGRWAR